MKGTAGQFVFSSGSHLLSMFSNVSLRVRSKHSTTTLEQAYERGRNVSLVDEVSRTVTVSSVNVTNEVLHRLGGIVVVHEEVLSELHS